MPATAVGMTITLWALGMVEDEILIQQGGFRRGTPGLKPFFEIGRFFTGLKWWS